MLPGNCDPFFQSSTLSQYLPDFTDLSLWFSWSSILPIFPIYLSNLCKGNIGKKVRNFGKIFLTFPDPEYVFVLIFCLTCLISCSNIVAPFRISHQSLYLKRDCIEIIRPILRHITPKSQDTLYQWSMPVNIDQCQIKFLALTPIPINNYQCRSMKINTDQYFSIWRSIDRYWSLLIGVDHYWPAFWINNRILIWHWSVLIDIDHWNSMSWKVSSYISIGAGVKIWNMWSLFTISNFFEEEVQNLVGKVISWRTFIIFIFRFTCTMFTKRNLHKKKTYMPRARLLSWI